MFSWQIKQQHELYKTLTGKWEHFWSLNPISSIWKFNVGSQSVRKCVCTCVCVYGCVFVCRRRLGASQPWASPTLDLSLSLHLHSFPHCSSLCSKHLAPRFRCSTLNAWTKLLSLCLIHLKTSWASLRLPLCQRSAAWGANNRAAAQIPKHCRDGGKAHTDTHTCARTHKEKLKSQQQRLGHFH